MFILYNRLAFSPGGPGFGGPAYITPYYNIGGPTFLNASGPGFGGPVFISPYLNLQPPQPVAQIGGDPPTALPPLNRPLAVPPALQAFRDRGGVPLGGAGPLGGPVAPPTGDLPVPGNIPVPGGGPARVIVSYRDGQGVGPHRVGIRPAAGGPITWHDLDDATLALPADLQTRISSSALLARQLGLTVRPDGTVIQFRGGGLPPIPFDIRNNGDLISRGSAGPPATARIVYRHNPGRQPRMFVEINDVTRAPIAGGVAAPPNMPITNSLLPLGIVNAANPHQAGLTAAGLGANTFYIVDFNPLTGNVISRIFNPTTNAWEALPARIMPAGATAVTGLFENGTYRCGVGGTLAGRAGDSLIRIPGTNNFFVLNRDGTKFRIVNHLGAAVGPAGWTNIAGHANAATYTAYAARITASRSTPGRVYTPPAD